MRRLAYRRPKFARLAQISEYFTAEAMRTQRHTCPRQHLKRTPTWSNVVRTKNHKRRGNAGITDKSEVDL